MARRLLDSAFCDEANASGRGAVQNCRCESGVMRVPLHRGSGLPSAWKRGDPLPIGAPQELHIVLLQQRCGWVGFDGPVRGF